MSKPAMHSILCSAVLTWDFQLIVERVCFKSTQPGRVLLQVPRFFLKSTHGCCQILHLTHKAFLFSLLEQLAAFRSQQLLQVFGKFLLRRKMKMAAVNSVMTGFCE